MGYRDIPPQKKLPLRLKEIRGVGGLKSLGFRAFRAFKGRLVVIREIGSRAYGRGFWG